VAAHTSEKEGISTRPAGEPGLRLTSDEDEIMHLVCCRDTTWAVALCGESSDQINLAGTVVCTMCVDVAEQLRPGCLSQDPLICPKDGEPCPDEHEIDLRILHEVTQ
jgi:hypothetical protein